MLAWSYLINISMCRGESSISGQTVHSSGSTQDFGSLSKGKQKVRNEEELIVLLLAQVIILSTGHGAEVGVTCGRGWDVQ